MSTVNTERSARIVSLIGLIALIVGPLMIIGGATTWGLVTSQLKAENITISEDAAMFGGKTVNGPLDAYAQADIINKHALEASEGKTYAELDKEDPVRATVMNGSFLRASLFTSVIAYGVAAFAIGMGALTTATGYALRTLAAAPAKGVKEAKGNKETK